MACDILVGMKTNAMCGSIIFSLSLILYLLMLSLGNTKARCSYFEQECGKHKHHCCNSPPDRDEKLGLICKEHWKCTNKCQTRPQNKYMPCDDSMGETEGTDWVPCCPGYKCVLDASDEGRGNDGDMRCERVGKHQLRMDDENGCSVFGTSCDSERGCCEHDKTFGGYAFTSQCLEHDYCEECQTDINGKPCDPQYAEADGTDWMQCCDGYKCVTDVAIEEGHHNIPIKNHCEFIKEDNFPDYTHP